MDLLQILEIARRRNVAENYYIYTQSEEGRAAEAELKRLIAACDAAEVNYLTNSARRAALSAPGLNS